MSPVIYRRPIAVRETIYRQAGVGCLTRCVSKLSTCERGLCVRGQCDLQAAEFLRLVERKLPTVRL
jgi:hypothetical protein